VKNYRKVNESLLLFEAICYKSILKELHISENLNPIKGIFLSGSAADVLIAEHSVLKHLLFVW